MKDILFAISVDAGGVGIPQVKADDATFNAIVGLIYTIIASIAVFFIVMGAFRFVTNGGDPSAVKAARDTILYAVVGLIGSTIVFAVIRYIAGSI